jgi:hypothetical protein
LERYGISAADDAFGAEQIGDWQRNAAHTIPRGLSYFHNGAGLHERVSRENGNAFHLLFVPDEFAQAIDHFYRG